MRRAGLLALVVAAAAAVGVLTAARSGHEPRAAAEAAAVVKPTYYRDVAPILAEHCTSCHTEGGVAPFPLDTAKAARTYARAIAAATAAGTMPPWPPGRDSQPFVGQSARVLGAAERWTLARWTATGAPAGAVRAVPRSAAPTSPAGSDVLTLQPAEAYTPAAANGGFDDYHCFLLDPKLAHDTYLTGAVIQPSATSLVHHVILFEAAGPQAAAATRLDAATGGKGWSCFGGPGLPADTAPSSGSSRRFGAPQWLAAWVPGHVTNTLPLRTGILLHAGAKIVMQVHYNLIHGSRPDRSQAVLTTAPASATLTPLETMLLAAPVELPCPRESTGPLCDRTTASNDLATKYGAGAELLPTGLLFLCGRSLADYAQQTDARALTTSCDRRVTQPLTVYGVAGHMHLRGRDISIVLDPGTAKQKTLLHIPRWDFRWQDGVLPRAPARDRAGRHAAPVVAGSTTRRPPSPSSATRRSPRATSSGARARPTRCASGC